MLHRAPGEGAAGVYSLTRLPLYAVPTGQPPQWPRPWGARQEQKPREGRGEEGRALAETEGVGGRAGRAKSQRPGWEVGFTAQAPYSIQSGGV